MAVAGQAYRKAVAKDGDPIDRGAVTVGGDQNPHGPSSPAGLRRSAPHGSRRGLILYDRDWGMPTASPICTADTCNGTGMRSGALSSLPGGGATASRPPGGGAGPRRARADARPCIPAMTMPFWLPQAEAAMAKVEGQ